MLTFKYKQSNGTTVDIEYDVKVVDTSANDNVGVYALMLVNEDRRVKNKYEKGIVVKIFNGDDLLVGRTILGSDESNPKCAYDLDSLRIFKEHIVNNTFYYNKIIRSKHSINKFKL